MARIWTRVKGAFVATVIAGATLLAIPASASATTGQSGPYWCSGERRANGSHTVQKYFWASGWGWTNWRVNVNAGAGDHCLMGRGGVYVSVGLPYSSVDQRGGVVTSAAYIQYYNQATNTIGSWIKLPMRYSWPTHQYGPPNGSYVTMNNTTYAYRVAVQTAAWTKQDGSNWVLLGTGWVYCNLYLTSTYAPGTCWGG